MQTFWVGSVPTYQLLPTQIYLSFPSPVFPHPHLMAWYPVTRVLSSFIPQYLRGQQWVRHCAIRWGTGQWSRQARSLELSFHFLLHPQLNTKEWFNRGNTMTKACDKDPAFAEVKYTWPLGHDACEIPGPRERCILHLILRRQWVFNYTHKTFFNMKT